MDKRSAIEQLSATCDMLRSAITNLWEIVNETWEPVARPEWMDIQTYNQLQSIGERFDQAALDLQTVIICYTPNRSGRPTEPVMTTESARSGIWRLR